MEGVSTTTFEDWQLVLLSPWGTAGLVLAGGAVLLVLSLSAWSVRRQRSVGVRALLVILRGLAALGVLIVVLQPALQLRNVTLIPNHVVLLVDRSRSMAVKEDREGPSRLQRAVTLLARSKGRIKGWRRRRVVDLYSFGGAVLPIQGDPAGLEAKEPVTRIRSALARVRQLYKGKDLAGVVLVSDGIDNGRFGVQKLSADARRFLVGLEAPVHTVWVGSSTIKDIAVTEVHSDAFAFVRNAVQVEADVTVHGMSLDRLPLQLEKMSGGVVAQKEIKLEPGRSSYRVRFDFVPQRVGRYVYTVSTPVQAGEALPGNNHRSFVVKVIRDRIRVLQVCGRPSWDERFLRRLLKRDPNIDLISFFILRTPTDLSLVPTSELSLIPFPTEELFEKELGSFDLVLLQNFNYRPYGIGIYLPHLRRFVEQGGGLAMIGGSLSFSSGGYHGTPVGQVLPVELLPDTGNPRHLIAEEDFRPRVTAEGKKHPILQLGGTARETTQLLGALPPLSGVNLVAGPTDDATVLATHPTLRDSSRRPLPVLATREVRKGRTLALTTDSSWYWAFHSVGSGGTRRAYDRFWRNAIRWLIRDPELRYLRVIVQRDSVPLGSPVRATIRAYNPDYSPARGARVSYEVQRLPGGEGTAKEARTNTEGDVPLELTLPREGAYRIRARATIGGRKNQEDALVLVEPAGPEERQPRATPELLKQLSRATSGRFLGQASELPELPFQDPRTVRVNWRRDVELWSRWWTLLACVLLLALEWLVRRRYGFL